MDEDGCSLITFYTQVREHETTVLIVQDEDGHIFGGFQTEPWVCKHKFYGDGQNFIYSFADIDQPNCYRYTGDGDQFQYSDDRSIGLGGSS